MKTTPPTIDERAQQPYAGIRTQVSHREFPTIIPKLLDETFGWLAQQAISPAGAPFMRYHVIDMDGLMDVELGVPVAEPVAGNGRVGAGVLPAGRASRTHSATGAINCRRIVRRSPRAP